MNQTQLSAIAHPMLRKEMAVSVNGSPNGRYHRWVHLYYH